MQISADKNLEPNQTPIDQDEVRHRTQNTSLTRKIFFWTWQPMWFAGCILGTYLAITVNPIGWLLAIPFWGIFFGSIYPMLNMAYGEEEVALSRHGLAWKKMVVGRVVNRKQWPLNEIIDVQLGCSKSESEGIEHVSHYVKFIARGKGIKFAENRSKQTCEQWVTYFKAILNQFNPQVGKLDDIQIKRIFQDENSSEPVLSGPPSDSRWVKIDIDELAPDTRLSFQKEKELEFPFLVAMIVANLFCHSMTAAFCILLHAFLFKPEMVESEGQYGGCFFLFLGPIMMGISFYAIKILLELIIKSLSLITYSFESQQIVRSRRLLKLNFTTHFRFNEIQSLCINPPGKRDKKSRKRSDSLLPDDEYQLQFLDTRSVITTIDDLTIGEAFWIGQHIAHSYEASLLDNTKE